MTKLLGFRLIGAAPAKTDVMLQAAGIKEERLQVESDIAVSQFKSLPPTGCELFRVSDSGAFARRFDYK